MERNAAQLVIKWLEFSIPNLSDYPPEYQIFVNNISKILAVEIMGISSCDDVPLTPTTPASPLRTANFFKPVINPPSTAVQREHEQHKKLRKILDLMHLGSDVQQIAPFPGVARYTVVADDKPRSVQYACLTKALTPEQVRNFFSDGIIKTQSQSGILLSSNGISDAKRFDIFGISDARDNQIPVVFFSNFPKDAKRMENLLEFADEVLTFLSTSEINDSKKFTLMPKLLHSLSDLITFMEYKNGIVQDITKESVKLPEYLSQFSGTNGSLSSRSATASVRSMGSSSVSANSVLKPRTATTTTSTTTTRPLPVQRVTVRPTSRTVATAPLARGRSAERVLHKQVSAGPVSATKTTTISVTRAAVQDPKKFRSLAVRGPVSSQRIQREIENYCAVHGYADEL